MQNAIYAAPKRDERGIFDNILSAVMGKVENIAHHTGSISSFLAKLGIAVQIFGEALKEPEWKSNLTNA